MRRWGMILPAVLVCVVALVLPFLYLDEADTYGPLGFRTQVWVRDVRPGADAAGLSRAVPEWASTRGVTVARFRAAADDAFFGRELFVAVGDAASPVAAWLTDGYPRFSTRSETLVLPWSALDPEQTDPRGYYLVDGQRAAGDELAELFVQHGFEAQAYERGGLRNDAFSMVSGVRGGSAAIALLVSVVLCGASVLLNAKAYAVGRLWGQRERWLLLRDAAQIAPPVLLGVCSLTVVAAILLWFHNGLSHGSTYLRLALITGSAMALVVAIAHVAAVRLTRLSPLVDALKGRLPARPTVGAAYLVRAVATGLTIASVIAALLLIPTANRSARGLESARAHAGTASYILLNGSLGQGDTTTLIDQTVAEWLKRGDVDRRLVLARDESRSYALAAGDGAFVPVLVVNPTYLEEQDVLAVGGGPLRPHDLLTDRVTVLVPQKLSERAAELRAAAAQQANEGRSRRGIGPLPDPDVRLLQAGQERFTYGSAVGSEAGVLDDAALVVVPPTLDVWGRQYVDMVEDLVLLQPGLPDDVRADPLLSKAVLATLPVTQKMSDDTRVATLNLATALTNAAVGLALLVAVVTASVAVYVKAWSQRIHVRLLHGWDRWLANPSWIALEAVMCLGVLSWGWGEWSAALQARAQVGSVPLPRSLESGEPAVALGVAVGVALASALVAAGTLLWRDRTLLRSRAVDAL